MKKSKVFDDGHYDQNYLEIWKVEQEHNRTRWTVTTFFISISFAILGFSFQTQANQSPVFLGITVQDVQRIVGLVIFWFSYALYSQFNRYTNYLRGQLRKMEKEKSVSLTIQSEADEYMYSGKNVGYSGNALLFFFGLFYTFVVLGAMLI